MLQSGEFGEYGDIRSEEQGITNPVDNPTTPVLRRDSGNEKDLIAPGSLQLRFLNTIRLPVFSGIHIKGEEHVSLRVALVDGHSGEEVKFGPEGSTRVKIVVLRADLGGREGDSLTPEEFNSKIVTTRGNKPIISGDVVLHLKDGTGSVGDIYFPNTRCWRSKSKYRLGVRAEDDSIATQITGGMTESFIVKDKRLKYQEKHYPPNPSDPVWRLDNISKDGAFHKRLKLENINTVADFLKKLKKNPEELQNILGKTMYAKKWKVLVDHAQKCMHDGKQYLYYSSESQQREKVVSSDDKACIFDESPGPTNTVCPSKSPIGESSSGSKILSSQNIEDSDLLQSAVSSQVIMGRYTSIGGVNCSFGYNFPSYDSMDHRHEISSQVTESDIRDLEPMFYFSDENDALLEQFLADDGSAGTSK